MLKSLTVMLGLQVFAAACQEDLKIETVGPRSPALSEAYCVSHPQNAGCNDFLKKPALSLGQMVPINSYQDHVVRLRGNGFTDDLKITIEGLDVPIFKISETDAFFITPSFDSPGIKSGVLKTLGSSIEFKLYNLAEKFLNPENLIEPSVVCKGIKFMLGDSTIAVGSKSCKLTKAMSCAIEREVGCKSNAIISDTDNVLAKSAVTISPTVTGAVSYAWSQVWGPGTITFTSPSSNSTAVSASTDGNYVISLVANDDAGNGAQKYINFTWDATAPTISSVSDISTKIAVSVSPTVTGATIYSWSQTAGPGSLTFASPSSNSTAVSASADGSYVFRLTATDAAGNSAQKDINFTWDTTPPIISDVSDIFTKSWVTVSPSVAGAVSYAWSQVSGPGLIIFASPSSNSTAVAASADGAYVLRLTATDAAGNSAQKDINFTWDTVAPVITVETQQTLYGMTASINPVVTGGDSYSWTNISGPGTAIFSNATTQSTTITVDKHGSYSVNYVVQDRAGNTAQQQITRYFNYPYSRSLAVGYNHSCAILADNSVKCWGGNSRGQLGYGNLTQLLAPAATPINLGPGKTALAIYAFYETTCALLNDNSLKCWGEGSSYQLGQGDNTDLLAPAASPINFGSGKTALAISGGWTHSCALLNDSSVKCWGASFQGEAGIGIADDYVTAPLAAGIDFGLGKTVVAISSGNAHNCAILNDGSVKCWGEGWYAQLGIGSTSELSAPAAAPIDLGPGKTALAISAGDEHTCAVLNDESVKCWGSGYSGQLGNGISGELLVPDAASIDLGSGKTALAISAGDDHTCALLNDNSVKCWGEGSSGQLGYGNTSSLLAPAAASIDLGPGKTAVAISAGGDQTCARLNDNSVKCWGLGLSGQLGYGNTGNLLAPDVNPINLSP